MNYPKRIVIGVLVLIGLAAVGADVTVRWTPPSNADGKSFVFTS